MLLQVKVILFVSHMIMRRSGSTQGQLSLFTSLTVLNMRGHIFKVTSKAAQVCRCSKSRWLDPCTGTAKQKQGPGHLPEIVTFQWWSHFSLASFLLSSTCDKRYGRGFRSSQGLCLTTTGVNEKLIKQIMMPTRPLTTKEEKARQEPWLQAGGRYWLVGKLTAREGQRREQAKNQGLWAKTVKGWKRKTHEGFKTHVLKLECARGHWIYFWLFNSDLTAPSSENTML